MKTNFRNRLRTTSALAVMLMGIFAAGLTSTADAQVYVESYGGSYQPYTQQSYTLQPNYQKYNQRYIQPGVVQQGVIQPGIVQQGVIQQGISQQGVIQPQGGQWNQQWSGQPQTVQPQVQPYNPRTQTTQELPTEYLLHYDRQLNPQRVQMQRGQSQYSTQGTPQYQQPQYQQTLIQRGVSKTHQGNDYQADAGIGFDQRTDFGVGVTYDSKDGRFAGARGSVGAGLYGDASASQSGRIGNVDVRNYAEGEAFVGTEAGAQAGLGEKGLQVGANGFAGGRVSGTVGTDVGPVGYGATGEAWSGVGAEIGANAGFKDGVLTFGGEVGGALGVGGKLGVQGSVDVGAVGDGIKKGAQHVGNGAKKVGNWSKDRAQDIGNGAKKFGNGAKKAGKKFGNGVKKGFGKVKGIFKK